MQETYLRAWRSFEGFEGRSSVRTWLYRTGIARIIAFQDTGLFGSFGLRQKYRAGRGDSRETAWSI